MKVSRKQAEENRKSVVAIAADLFRQHGFDGIGVADLMKSAGLTHGGFYASFGSKEALMAMASAEALSQNARYWQQQADNTEKLSLRQLMQQYLQLAWQDNHRGGCVLTTLGSDIPRKSATVRQPVTEGVAGIVDVLSQLMPGETAVQQRQRALAFYATSVGALIMAASVDDAQLSDEILTAASELFAKPPAADLA